jgi:hypothetical protein
VLYYDYQMDENTGQSTVSQVSLAEEVHGQSITISQAKRALGRFIADMAHVCTECLPELPPVVRVTVELDMNNQAPVDYCPPGLVSYAAENSRFADTEDWECRTRSVAKMNAGYHEVKLKVNYLTPRHDDVLAIVPSGLPCTKEVLVAAVAAVDLATSSAAPPDSCEQASQEKAIEISRATHSGSTHLTLKARETGSDGDKLRLDSSSRQKTQATESSPGVTTMGPASHSSADMRVKDQLARMVMCHASNTDQTNFICSFLLLRRTLRFSLPKLASLTIPQSRTKSTNRWSILEKSLKSSTGSISRCSCTSGIPRYSWLTKRPRKRSSLTANAAMVAKRAAWLVSSANNTGTLLTFIPRFVARFATSSNTCTVSDTVQKRMAVSLQCTSATHAFFMASHRNSFTRLERRRSVVE